MIKLINKDGVLCIEKGNGIEELCSLEELKSINIKSDDILVQTDIADISFEIERGKAERGCGGSCGGCGNR